MLTQSLEKVKSKFTDSASVVEKEVTNDHKVGAAGFFTASNKMGKCSPFLYAKYRFNIVNGQHTTGFADADRDCDGRNSVGGVKQFGRNLHNPTDNSCQQFIGIRGFGGACRETGETKNYVPRSWTKNADGTETVRYWNDCVSTTCESAGKNLTIHSSELGTNKYNNENWTWR